MAWDSTSGLQLRGAINGGSLVIDGDGDVRIARSGFQNTYDSGDNTRTIGFELGMFSDVASTTFIDFHATTGTDNNARIIRYAGTDGEMKIEQLGAGDMILWHNGTTGGEIRFKNNSFTGTATGTVFEHTIEANGFNSTSSRRFKTNIQPMTGSLTTVEKLSAVTFDWKDGRKMNDIGFIAEEVDGVLPQVVQRNYYGEIQSVDYSKLTPLLVQAIQELSAEVKALKAQINGQ